MYEALEFGFGTSVRRDLQRTAAACDLRYLLKRQLARQDDAAEAELLQREDAFEVVGDQLGGGVELELREMPAAEACHAEVLNDQRVGGDFGEQGERFRRRFKLSLVEKSVEGNVDAARRVLCVGVGDKALQLVRREVLRECARRELRKAAVYGVGSGGERGKRRREVARWRKQFRCCLHAAYYTISTP